MKDRAAHVLVMTRLPREGRNKTRLIPALGSAGASRFHDRLARHSIARASAYCQIAGAHLTVLLEGGGPFDGREWLGDWDLDCRGQCEGDLGRRMHTAISNAFAEGAGCAILIGTDCPSIDEEIFSEIARLLTKNDLVYVPAEDGGYCLIAMNQPYSCVFHDIPWGSGTVLENSLRAAKIAGIKTALSDPLSDVDLPEDLLHARTSLERGASISVVIPTFNEAETIAPLIKSLAHPQIDEIIVADGGSTDNTRAIAIRAGAKVISTDKSRAKQMNQGAMLAQSEFVCFLHADSIPPKEFAAEILSILNTPGVAAGAFRFQLGGEKIAIAAIMELFVDLRCRIFHTPYGDQGIFVRCSIFNHLGGFPDLPILEDLYLIKKLSKIGKIQISRASMVTSSRRWENGGILQTFLRHQLILLLDRFGFSPGILAKLR
ncbi:TIGR04283 family arsenosugar biosynthesis glycosyltransferase [Luteolibacter algae]|uniref:TIGR04283 family arsenosugar biosynthesis glycosyltransferase n=1 Tax=Luteolibacter algae TaxID=454151 RepID=A0ABW5D734_9BACT